MKRPLRARRLLVLVPAAISYVTTIAEPSNSTLGIRSVEWLRDHGAAGLVSKVESIYYSMNAPAKGGPALHALPVVHGSGTVTSGVPLLIGFSMQPFSETWMTGDPPWVATFSVE